MRILDAYIGRTVTSFMALVLLVLFGILTVFRYIAELDSLRGSYGFAEISIYIAYTSPRYVYDLIPYAAMIGALLGLGRLASHAEITVMRSAGLSSLRISWGAVRPILVLVVCGVLLGEFVIPPTERLAQKQKLDSRTLAEARDVSEWYREGNLFVHFGRVDLGGSADHISIYEFDAARRLKRSVYARRGVHHQPHPGEGYWLLEGVEMTDFFSTSTRSDRLISWRWDTTLDPVILESQVNVDSGKLSLAELSRKVAYLSRQDMRADAYRLAFWTKALQPLATLALVFIAVSFVFGPLRETGAGYRIVAGLLTGIVFKFVQDLLAPASLVFGFSPLLAAALPIAICVLLGMGLMYRSR